MSTVGENIRRIREEQKLSQAKVAEAAKIAQSTLSAIENGHQNPSVCVVNGIADALQCSTNALLKETDQAVYDPYVLPQELLHTLGRMNRFELQRVQDFASGILAARVPEVSDFAS